MSAVITVPTVQAQGDPYFSRMEDQSNGSLVSLGGGPLKANQYLLDGVSVDDLTGRTEDFRRRKRSRSSRSRSTRTTARWAAAAAACSTPQDGPAPTHCTAAAFGQVRPNWALDEPFFSARAGEPKSQAQEGAYYHYAGSSFGGPIVKNHTFFYFAYEGYWDAETRELAALSPHPQELQGNFSQTFNKNGQLIPIYDPATTALLANGTYTRSQFGGNIIPANRLSPVALAIAQYLPTASVSAADGVPNATSTVPVPTWAMQFYGKFEHKVSDKDTFTGLYLFQPDDEGAANYWKENVFADPERRHRSAARQRRRPEQQLGAQQHDGGEPPVRLDVFHRQRSARTDSTSASLDFPVVVRERHDVPEIPFRGGTRLLEPESASSATAPSSRICTRRGPPTAACRSSWAARRSSTAPTSARSAWQENGTDYSSGNFNFATSPTQQNPLVASSAQGSGLATFLLGMGTGTTPVTTPLNFFVRYAGAYVQDDFRVNSKTHAEWRSAVRVRDRHARDRQPLDRQLRPERGQPAVRVDRAESARRPRLCGSERRADVPGHTEPAEVLAARRLRLDDEPEHGGSWRVRPVPGRRLCTDTRFGQLRADRLHRDQPDLPEQRRAPDGHARQSVSKRAPATDGQLARPADVRRRHGRLRRPQQQVSVRAAGPGRSPAPAGQRHVRVRDVRRYARRQPELRRILPRVPQHQHAHAGAAGARTCAQQPGQESVLRHRASGPVFTDPDDHLWPAPSSVPGIRQRPQHQPERCDQPVQRRHLRAEQTILARLRRALQLHLEPAQ